MNVRVAPARLGYLVFDAEAESEVATTAWGGLLAASYERSVSNALSWRVDAGVSTLGKPFIASSYLAAGLVYRFDVLKYVPYASVGGAGLFARSSADKVGTILTAGAHVAVGLDVLRTRDASWGVEASAVGLVGDVTLYSLGLRWAWRWGYW